MRVPAENYSYLLVNTEFVFLFVFIIFIIIIVFVFKLYSLLQCLTNVLKHIYVKFLSLCKVCATAALN